MKIKQTTESDLRHKLRAQLVQLYEAACHIEFPKGSDAAFRDAIAARIQAGVGELAKEHTDCEELLICTAQDVRLYKASAEIRNPDAQALEFRVAIQKKLGAFFRLQGALKEVVNG